MAKIWLFLQPLLHPPSPASFSIFYFYCSTPKHKQWWLVNMLLQTYFHNNRLTATDVCNAAYASFNTKGLRCTPYQELQPSVELIFNCVWLNGLRDIPESSAAACPSCAWSCTIPHVLTYEFAGVGKTPSSRSWSHCHHQTVVWNIIHSLCTLFRQTGCNNFYILALFTWWYNERIYRNTIPFIFSATPHNRFLS